MDKSSRILITGGTGFLGKNLVNTLTGRGFRCVVPVGKGNGYDLVSPIQARNLFEDVKPQVVFHLAATVGGIGANRKSPGRFWYENTMLGANILECAKDFGTEKLVIVGTTCAYPKYCPTPFREDKIWEGYPEETNAPYGVAKKSIMVGAMAYAQEYGLDVANPILTNLYGPGDHYTQENSHVIPDMIRKFHEAKMSFTDVTLWGDGTPSRDFLYVKDACEGLLKVAQLPVGPTPINFGAGVEVKMSELAETIAEVVQYHGTIRWDSSKPNGQPRRLLDTTRARDLGWEPMTSLQLGLRMTYEDYRERHPDFP
jgi:GDP-L-fucose synthase